MEPVVEVDNEDNDNALSSAPSSISLPGGYDHWHGNNVTRKAYEAVLVEIEELQSKLCKKQREMSCAKIQICDLEKALLHEV